MRYSPCSFSNFFTFPPWADTTNYNNCNNNSYNTSDTQQELSKSEIISSNGKYCFIIPRSSSDSLIIPINFLFIKFICWVIIYDESILWNVLKWIYRFWCYVFFYFDLDWSALNCLFSWDCRTKLKVNILLFSNSCYINIKSTLVSCRCGSSNPGYCSSCTVYYTTCGIWTRVYSCISKVLGYV